MCLCINVYVVAGANAIFLCLWGVIRRFKLLIKSTGGKNKMMNDSEREGETEREIDF